MALRHWGVKGSTVSGNRGKRQNRNQQSGSWNQQTSSWNQQGSSWNQQGSSWNRQSSGKGKRKGKGKDKAKHEGEGPREIERLVFKAVQKALGKGKSKGKGDAMTEAEQQEEARAQQVAKNEEHVAKTNRVKTELETTGHLARRKGSIGWIILDWLEDLDEMPELKTRLEDMCATNRKKIRKEGREDNLFSGHVVFMHLFEMKEGYDHPKVGEKLKFKLYTDDIGVGAYDIEIVKNAKRQAWSRTMRRRKW